MGAARNGQDHRRAASGAGDAPRVRAAFGDLFGRTGSPQGVRPGQEPPRDGPRHPAVHRRDPSLQPGAAGQLPPLHGGRHDHARGCDDRKPFVRAQRRRPVARSRPGFQPARRCGLREDVAARGKARGARSSPRGRCARRAESHGRRRRPHHAQHGRGGVCRRPARPARPRRPDEACPAPRPALRQIPRRPLQPDQRAAQVGARLRSRCGTLLARAHAPGR